MDMDRRDAKRLLRNEKDFGLAGRLNKDNSDRALNKKDTHIPHPNHPEEFHYEQVDLAAEERAKHPKSNIVSQDEIGMNEKKVIYDNKHHPLS